MKLQDNKLIAIGGLKNSGKDEASKMLQYCLSVPKILRQYCFYKYFSKFVNHRYKIVSFADHLKDCLSSLTGIAREKFNNRDFKENHYIIFDPLCVKEFQEVNPNIIIPDNCFNRMLANKDFSFFKNCYITIRQLLQAFGTNIARDIFGDKLWIQSTLNCNKDNNIIVSDMRFKVEFDSIKLRDGITIYINRPEAIPGNHASEQEIYKLYILHKFDYVINNSGTLRDLFNKIKYLCQ